MTSSEPAAAYRLTVDDRLAAWVARWNATAVDVPTDMTVHALFRRQAERTPTAIAAQQGDARMSYEELDARSEAVASVLTGRRASTGEQRGLVALLADRSPMYLAGLLGVLKAGLAYLPLDPRAPVARNRSMLAQSQGGCLLYGASHRAMANDLSEPARTPDLVELESAVNAVAGSRAPASLPADGDELAYVIFTSGSSGAPKGAMVGHAALVNHLCAKITDLDMTPADIVAQTAPQSFDIHLWQFLAPLVVGARVEVFDDHLVLDPRRLVGRLVSSGTTVLELVPSYMPPFLEAVDRHVREDRCSLPLRWLMLGGEALRPAVCRAWLQRFPEVPIMNAYGPTECADDVCHHVVTTPPSDDTTAMPIGRPLANTQLYVAVETEPGHLRARGPGEQGELFVGGVPVGLGYINDREKAAAAFLEVVSPWGRETLYRTGDLVEITADGLLIYRGRTDRQVKVRGQRIELDEIEAVLSTHPAVRHCAARMAVLGQQSAVVAREVLVDVASAMTGELIGYVEPLEATLTAAEVVEFLSERLPDAMVPRIIVFLDTIPITANGKIDYGALPEPDARRYRASREPADPPVTAEERVCCEIFKRVLQVDGVGTTDTLYELGGNSLAAMRIAALVSDALGTVISTRHVLDGGSVSTLLQWVREGTGDEDSGEPVPVGGTRGPDGSLPLSVHQERAWFHWKLEPDSPYYTYQAVLRLDGAVEGDAAAAAWRTAISRNPQLAARFTESQGRPRQRLGNHSLGNCDHVDLRMLDDKADIERRLREEARRQVEIPFDLQHAPALRCTLMESRGRVDLLLTMHEVLLDGWGAAVLAQQFADALADSHPAPEPRKECPDRTGAYERYLEWERANITRQRLRQEKEYWQDQLAGAPRLINLPRDGRRRPRPTYKGESIGAMIDASTTAALERLSREENITMFSTLLGCYAVLLDAYARQQEVVIGSPMANRPNTVSQEVASFLINMLPLRVRVDTHLSFKEFLRRVHAEVTGAVGHARYPFSWMARFAGGQPEPGVSPVFQVMFNMLNYPQPVIHLDRCQLRLIELETGYTKYDLSLYAQEQHNQLYLQLSYHVELFERATVERMLANLESCIARVSTDPHMQVGEIRRLVN